MVKMTLTDGADTLAEEGSAVVAFVMKDVKVISEGKCEGSATACLLGESCIGDVLLAAYVGLAELTDSYADRLGGAKDIFTRIALAAMSELKELVHQEVEA